MSRRENNQKRMDEARKRKKARNLKMTIAQFNRKQEGQPDMDRLIEYLTELLSGDNQMPKLPTDTDIRHITLNSCHRCNIPNGKVTSDVIEAYRPLLLDNRMLIPAEELLMAKQGGRCPLPYSDGRLGLLVTSDPDCGGDELSFTIYLRDSPMGPMPLVFGRYYHAKDETGPLKWIQLVKWFSISHATNFARPCPGFNHTHLIAPPATPWLGVWVTSVFDTLEDYNLGLFLSSAEQAIAVTWNTIRNEAQTPTRKEV